MTEVTKVKALSNLYQHHKDLYAKNILKVIIYLKNKQNPDQIYLMKKTHLSTVAAPTAESSNTKLIPTQSSIVSL